LTKIRGLDSRNTALVNKLRNVSYGEKVDVKEFLKEISKALEPVGNPGSINDVDGNDDGDDMETLNINKLLGND